MLSNPTHNLSNICSCPSHTVRQDISTECPDILEVLNAINALKANKAPGADNIAPEMLKADPQLTANILLPLIENFWLSFELDANLKEGIIVNIPKKGDLTDCRNWRGITILSAVNKIIAHIINKRISDAVIDDLRPEQAGFRPQKSCIDHINSLRIIIEQSAEWHSPLYMVFIDFERAFDTLSHNAIWSALACKGVPPKIIQLTQALYADVKCRVVHDNALSNSFNVVTGVRQGCILSPLLFNIVLDVIVRNATRTNRGIRWGLTQQLESLEYADDICLLSHSYRHMSAKLKSLETEAAKAGLKINTGKSKVMRCNTLNNSKFKIQDVELEEVKSFCYLGSILTHTGGCSNDVAYRLSKAKQSFGMLRSVWKSTSISEHTKISIFNSCVKSVLLYACESLNMTSRESNAIQVFVNRCLRRILKIFWPNTISNTNLWQRTNQRPINIEILNRKWRWIGHSLRRPHGDPTKSAIDWNPHGNTRRVGRPSHTWRRQLESEVNQSGLSWREIKHLASNRIEWKEFVAALCSY